MIFAPYLLIPAAYLIGSVPTAVWTGKILHGLDIRDHGSGNAGATNVMRVLGIKTGIPVLIIDMVKGLLAVKLVHFQSLFTAGQESYIAFSIVLGAAAVVGHIFPVLAGFRGGKGVATITGVCIAIHPLATIFSIMVFVLVLLISRYVSLGSVIAGLSFPVWIMLVFQSEYKTLWIFSLFVAVLLLVTHNRNIRRLVLGKEPIADFIFRKKKEN
ncbi:MAG: glycerol-3-phosphate 1-O-acyltransferase PlsY [Bacteroidales bacterium]|nr:glycerol-3-phosphate 1-O-acyltransferase PlsY [Bacteroidales bacterium]